MPRKKPATDSYGRDDKRRALRAIDVTLSEEALAFLEKWGGDRDARGQRSVVVEAAITRLRGLLDREIEAEVETARTRRLEITRKHRDAMPR